jgi:uncharacterized protein YdhG (YjbR/CyaY superfamily)
MTIYNVGMSENKTKITDVEVEAFLSSASPSRRVEAETLIDIMEKVSGLKPAMWGPSIIGFGSKHYKYDSGREGDMPILGFSPRKSAITIYFAEGFDRYGEQLKNLGKYKSSVSCLYINKLKDINLDVLTDMVKQSFQLESRPMDKPESVDDYIAQVPLAAKAKFDELRTLVKSQLPHAKEVLSYGIIGYKIDDKRARIYISGWKDHLAIYPVPSSPELQSELKPYIRGKGTLWFALDEPLPKELIATVVECLAT